MGARTRGHVLREAADDAERILQGVPAGDLEHDRHVRGQAHVLGHLGVPLYAGRRAVLALERGRWPALHVAEDSAVAQDGTHGGRIEIDVLRRERINRWRYHRNPAAVEPLPGEALAREDIRSRREDVLAQEVPRFASALVRSIEADVAAPDHRRAGVHEAADQPRGLRVVNDYDVAFLNPRDDAHRVL